MFSATTNQDVLTVSWKYQHDPIEIVVQAQAENKPNITQYIVESDQKQKYEHLLYLLDSDQYKRVMIFCNTKDMTARLCERLKKAGYNAECLHGDVRQSLRDKVMSGFRKGEFEILVATDVAARGIDVDDVEAVFNYDLPDKQEFYVHRIGRTGRAKRAGVSFSLSVSETVFVWTKFLSILTASRFRLFLMSLEHSAIRKVGNRFSKTHKRLASAVKGKAADAAFSEY